MNMIMMMEVLTKLFAGFGILLTISFLFGLLNLVGDWVICLGLLYLLGSLVIK